MKTRIIGVLLLTTAVAIMLVINYLNSDNRQVPLVFSPKTLLSALWSDYKTNQLEPETMRTLDKTRNHITTSEGESYTMMRAVWMDDKEIFDKSWAWTKDNLQHDNDKLFAWLFGEKSPGEYGVITDQGGNNSASDADQDIALALIFASERWGDAVYLGDALALLDDIWLHEVAIINERPYFLANNIEKTSPGDFLVNPSYLAPYAYRIFAKVDPEHDWQGLVDTSYEILETSSASVLDKPTSAGLPPDWINLDPITAQIKPVNENGLTSNFGFDALRVPWRLAIDWQWFQYPRAQELLKKFSFLSSEWQRQQVIYSNYSHDGQVVQNIEAPALYGGIIGYFMAADPKQAEQVFNKKLKNLYNNDVFSWVQPLPYYDDNWAWFGIALYYQQLTNLFKE